AIDLHALSQALGFPVEPTVAIRKNSLTTLTNALPGARPSDLHLKYAQEIEQAIGELIDIFSIAWMEMPPVTPRSLALMFLSRDRVAEEWLERKLSQEIYRNLEAVRGDAQSHSLELLSMHIQQTRIARANA